MSSVVAWGTERDPIGGVVPSVAILSPRDHVVNLQLAAPASAVLARPVVTPKASVPERDVPRVPEVCIPERAMSASPVGVVGATHDAYRGPATSLTDPSANRGSVLRRQRSSCQRVGYGSPLLWRRNPAQRRWLPLASRRNLRSRRVRLGRAVVDVRPRLTAGVRAEPLAACSIGGPALFTDSSRHKTEYTTWN